ncbi:MAG: AgmX/PglI C-terminal domain-containing protein [Bdellovibrionota bacterium]
MKRTYTFVIIWFLSVLSFSYLQLHSMTPAEHLKMLLQVVNNSKVDIKSRIAAAQELGQISDGTVVPKLVESYNKLSILDPKEKALKMTLLYSIGSIPEETSLQTLISLAESYKASPQEKDVIARILWNYRDQFDLNAWETMTTSEHVNHTKIYSYIWLLGIIGDEQTIDLFDQILSNYEGKRNRGLRTLLITSIEWIGGERALQSCEQLIPFEEKLANHCIQHIQQGIQPSFKKHLNLESHNIANASIRPQTSESSDVALYQPSSSQGANTSKNIGRPNEETYQYQDVSKTRTIVSTATYQQLTDYIDTKLPEIYSCANQRKIEGTIKTQIDIGKGGKVLRANVTESSLNNKQIEKCVESRLASLQFPQTPYDELRFHYNFRFDAVDRQHFDFSSR